MARIVLGLASSHTPQLSSGPDWWPRHGENDKNNPWLIDRQGRKLTYDQALAQANPRIGREELTPEKHAARHATVQAAVEHLQQELLACKPDVVVVFGDDQAEIFNRDFRPALMVYSGESVPNMPYLFSRAPYEAGRQAGWAYGEELATIPIKSDLAKHVVSQLMDEGFDLAHAAQLEEGVGLGHAYGFVFGRIMNGHVAPLLPIIINTLYPPNQPTAWRCYDLGRAVKQAIDSWDQDLRVCVVGSGGLSHFLVDEELDHQFLELLRTKDADGIRKLPQVRLQSGTGELRSWIGAAAALEELPLAWTEYQACYRSPAGSGMGMGFAVWK
jgi:hypothetical protein